VFAPVIIIVSFSKECVGYGRVVNWDLRKVVRKDAGLVVVSCLHGKGQESSQIKELEWIPHAAVFLWAYD
jgi:hypothetical protein